VNPLSPRTFLNNGKGRDQAPARDEDQKMSDDDKPVLAFCLTDKDLSGPYLLGGSLSMLLDNVCYQRWGNGPKQAYATVVATMVAHMLSFEERPQVPNTFQRLVDTFNEQLVQQWSHMELGSVAKFGL
jgi:hypothetical protein